MKKTFFLILFGIMLGFAFSIVAENITWWYPSNYQQTQQNDKTSEVQIWCELRVKRSGWENYCRWTGKYWKLTCLGVERVFGQRIEPLGGNYGCREY